MREIDLSSLALRWVLNALALWLTSLVIPGIDIRGIGPTFVAALVLGILNAILRPVLFWLTLPITVLTLGLFALVINAVMLMLTGSLVDGFVVAGFWSALFGAIVLSVISVMLSLFVGAPRGARIEVVYHRVDRGRGDDYPPHIR